MRILMLSEFYPPSIGGAERHVQTLSRELVRRGHHVAVATLQEGLPAFGEDEGVRVYRLDGCNRLLKPFYRDQKHPLHPPAPDPRVMAGLQSIVERERPQIVHSRNWMSYSFIGIKAWSKAKLVVTLHDYSLCCPRMTYLNGDRVCTGPGNIKCMCCASAHYGPVKALLLTGGLKISSHLHRYVDKYIAISPAVQRAGILRPISTTNPIEVVPTFIPDSALQEADQCGRPSFLPPLDNYILFVGRQTSAKGLDVLLEAYTGLSDLAPLVLMITDPGDRPRHFPAGVTVLRNVPHAQVMAGWMHCAVGVVPSIWPEPFGQVAIEAMMCGKPIVASAVGGLADLVHDGESGLLVEPGDANALREALRVLLSDPARREQMGNVARQQARQFTVSNVTDRIEQVYLELLGR